MNQNIPDNDAQAIERHRAEARRYLPPTDYEYQEAIDNGSDEYASRWLGYACIVLVVATIGFFVLDVYLWTPYR